MISRTISKDAITGETTITEETFIEKSRPEIPIPRDIIKEFDELMILLKDKGVI